jgi:hypothetical protein
VQSRAESGDLIVTACGLGIEVRAGRCRIVSVPRAE